MHGAPSSTPRRFAESDADRGRLSGKRVVILGYGNQGHAHALNLRDSGVDVIVALRPGSKHMAEAEAAGLSVQPPRTAARTADIVMVLIPDELQATVLREEILPVLEPSAYLAFAHGFTIAFGWVDLTPQRRAFLVAPKGQGHKLREAYLAGGGLPSLIGVHGPDAEATLQVALAYALACGALKGGGTLSSFREEAVSDQFGEQVVLCGGMIELITAAWETLVERGYDPTTAYFECLHEVKLIVDLMHAEGVDGMRQRISSTAAFGGLRAGRRVIAEQSRTAMRELLDEIEDGRFASAFGAEQASGGAWLSEAMRQESEHPMQRTGRGLREFLDRCRLGHETNRPEGH
jgi:ketol-acid reductoisomerase